MPKRSKEETKENFHESVPPKTIFVDDFRRVQSRCPAYNFKPFLQYDSRRLWYNRDNAFQEIVSSKNNLTENEQHGRYPTPEPGKDSRHRLLSKEKVIPMRYEKKSLKNEENIKRRWRNMRRLPPKQREKKCDNLYKDIHAFTDMDTDVSKYADTDEDTDAGTDTDEDADANISDEEEIDISDNDMGDDE